MNASVWRAQLQLSRWVLQSWHGVDLGLLLRILRLTRALKDDFRNRKFSLTRVLRFNQTAAPEVSLSDALAAPLLSRDHSGQRSFSEMWAFSK